MAGGNAESCKMAMLYMW